MSTLSLLIGLNSFCLIIYLHKVNQIHSLMCQHTQENYPSHWQTFLARGKLMGNSEKWAKHLAIDAVIQGSLSTQSDASLMQLRTRRKKLDSSALVTVPFIIVIATLVAELT